MKKTWLSFLLVAMLLTSASMAHAIGVGFYAGMGTGSGDWEDDYGFTTNPKFSSDTKRTAIGLSLDTTLAGNRLFNYHLNIGREKLTSKNFIARHTSGTPSATGDLELEGMVISNTFGFGGALSKNVRIWIGPELRWHWVEGSPSKASAFDLDGVGFGFGPSLGVNFNFSSGLTLVLKAGYIMSSYYLDGDGYIGSTYVSNDYDMDEKFTYLNLELLFRSRGDR